MAQECLSRRIPLGQAEGQAEGRGAHEGASRASIERSPRTSKSQQKCRFSSLLASLARVYFSPLMGRKGEALTTSHGLATASSRLQIHPPQQVLEARVVADGVEVGPNICPKDTGVAFVKGVGQQFNGPILVAKH